MRTRQEIKAIGKDRFMANYWNCVLACLLIAIAMGVLYGLSNGPAFAAMARGHRSNSSVTITFSSSIGSLALLVLSGPLSIGLCYFFVMNVLGRSDISISTPFTAAFTNFGRKLGGSLWMALFVFLWSMLFIIPGIIKGFSYAMTQYILADCPNVKARDALKLSMRIMNGHKADLFVFFLSFLGWNILGALTFGILNLFYVSPYMNSSLATFYLEVREDALRRGVITMGQLEGTVAV